MARKCQGSRSLGGLPRALTRSRWCSRRGQTVSPPLSHGLFGRESQAPYASRSSWVADLDATEVAASHRVERLEAARRSKSDIAGAHTSLRRVALLSVLPASGNASAQKQCSCREDNEQERHRDQVRFRSSRLGRRSRPT